MITLERVPSGADTLMGADRYRSYMLGLLTAVYAFNFMDRNILNLLMQAIKTDLRLSDTQLGLLTGIAFALFYSALGIPIARRADRGNRVSIIALSTGLWSCMVVFCGMATSFAQLLLARVCVAVGEAGCVPPAQSLISDYYSRSERPRAMAYYMLGMPISVIFAFAVGGWVNELYGWRLAFFIVGLPGLLLTFIVRFTLREPRLSFTTNSYARRESGGYLRVFAALWHQPAYRHLVLAFTLLYLFSSGISQWAPSFLIRTHHVSTGELGSWYALIWGVGGAVGTYAGGYLATRYAADNERLQLKVMAAILFSFIPVYLGIYLSSSMTVVFSLMTVSALLFCSIFGPLYAMIQQLVAPEMRATSIAIVLFFSNLIGMGVGPVAVGVISDLIAPKYGDESLRVALLLWTPGYVWAVFHIVRAGKYIDMR